MRSVPRIFLKSSFRWYILKSTEMQLTKKKKYTYTCVLIYHRISVGRYFLRHQYKIMCIASLSEALCLIKLLSGRIWARGTWEDPHSVILFFMTSSQLLYLSVYFLYFVFSSFFPFVNQNDTFHLSALRLGSIQALTD